ncbi:hypothetical protein GCM10023143_23660 [Compostibacter hankyongensis]|uniref:Corrinoid adenosyltransferase n=2 Tax=Compostibacter hankyongensis TaxID=1007089 RepID=A0ABP8FY49_9BACT
MALPALREADVRLLETEIDKMEAQLPPLKAFLLPGGHPAVSGCHIARCVCRRAERLSVRMEDQGLAVAPLILAYLNRLSDYLFVLARYTAHRLGVAERIWTTR